MNYFKLPLQIFEGSHLNQIENADGLGLFEFPVYYREEARQAIHAANTLPALEERNAELVEALQNVVEASKHRDAYGASKCCDIATHALARAVLAKEEAAND